MSERPFMQLYVSDFIGDTLQLSTEQIGAYTLLLMAMWNAGGKLPNDDVKLARIVRLSLKKWRSSNSDLMGYFEADGDHISHNRLTKELQKSISKSHSRASAGAKGGAAKSLKNNDQGQAIAKQNPKHLPDTIYHIESKNHGEAVARQTGAVFSNEKLAKDFLWNRGVDEIVRTTDKSQQQAKSAIGHLLKFCKDDVKDAANLLSEAIAAGSDDLVGYCKAQIGKRLIPGGPETQQPKVVAVREIEDRYPILAQRHISEMGKKPLKVHSRSWFPESWVQELEGATQ